MVVYGAFFIEENASLAFVPLFHCGICVGGVGVRMEPLYCSYESESSFVYTFVTVDTCIMLDVTVLDGIVILSNEGQSYTTSFG